MTPLQWLWFPSYHAIPRHDGIMAPWHHGIISCGIMAWWACRLVHVKKLKFTSRQMSTPFFIRTVKFFTRLFYVPCCEDLTRCFLFRLTFPQLRFSGNVDHLSPICFDKKKKKKKNAGQASRSAFRTRVQISGSISQ